MRMSLEEYHRVDAMSKGKLDKLEKSALHYKASLETPPEPTPQMIFGAAYHLMALEPGEFPKYYIVPPKIDRRTKEGKARTAEFDKESE